MHVGEGNEDGPVARRDAALERLARDAAAGDRWAMDAFLTAVRPVIVRYCRARLGGAARISAADDVAQEVLIAVLKRLPGMEPTGPLLPFVYGIARNKVADAFRAVGRDQSQPSAVVPDHVDEDDTGPEMAALRSADAARLKQALGQLQDNHREVLVLRIGMGYSALEVADLVGSTAGAVRVTQHRAMQRLRVLMSVGDAPE